MLKDCLGKFLNAMQDTNLNVRRVALVTFNSAAHNKPSLVRDLLVNPKEQENTNESFINFLYRETKVRGVEGGVEIEFFSCFFFFLFLVRCVKILLEKLKWDHLSIQLMTV